MTSSVGMMILPNTWTDKIPWFQTTNQIIMVYGWNHDGDNHGNPHVWMFASLLSLHSLHGYHHQHLYRGIIATVIATEIYQATCDISSFCATWHGDGRCSDPPVSWVVEIFRFPRCEWHLWNMLKRCFFLAWAQNIVNSKLLTLNHVNLYHITSIYMYTYIYANIYLYIYIYILIGGFNPLKNMKVLRKSDWIIIPTMGENKKAMVPNHQPVFPSSFPPVLHDLLGVSDQPASPKEVH